LRRIARFYRTKTFFRYFETAGENPRLVRLRNEKFWRPTRECGWNSSPGQHSDGAASVPHKAARRQRVNLILTKARNSARFPRRFEIWLGDAEHYHLKTGDSLYFESTTPHRWRNPGRIEACLLWVNTPQRSNGELND